MKLLELGRKNVQRWPGVAVILLASLAAFSCYTSMYAFRKAFAAGVFEHITYFNIDYKVWLVIAQMIGYTLSKFYGISFIAESSSKSRAKNLIGLILIAWAALLAFALVPAPYNVVFMLINGFPLGMIWGLVFSYLEGRKATEFMGAILSVSLIFASGFVKTVARTLMAVFPVNEYWMPFLTGLIFIVPFLLSVYCLELIPAPTKEDQQLRTKRLPMDHQQRKAFFWAFFPGLLLTLIIYVLLTILRDMRDNFEVEIWANLNIHDNHIYTQTDSIVAILVLITLGLLILIRDNLKAFTVIHIIIISGCLLAGTATFCFANHWIGAVPWMCIVGLGLYLAYIPYNAIFYERMIANFHFKSNVGFVIYLSDSLGYLGSVAVLLFREFNTKQISWGIFYQQSVVVVSLIGCICAISSLVYFRKKTNRFNLAHKNSINESLINS